MEISRTSQRLKHLKILLAIVDNEHGEIIEQYKKSVGDLDPFELKRLLQNICEQILSENRREILSRYSYTHIPQKAA